MKDNILFGKISCVCLKQNSKIAKKFSLKDGIIVEAKVERGKLLILRKKNKIKIFMQFAGMWKNENVDKVFSKIRKDWN